MGGTVRMERALRKAVAVIANGTTESSGVDVGGGVIASLGWPNGWTAADLAFQASFDNGTTWANVYDDAGAQVKILSASLPAAEARAIVNKALLEQLAGLPRIRLVSSVAQGAERSIIVFIKG